jgi:hypothetical protein
MNRVPMTVIYRTFGSCERCRGHLWQRDISGRDGGVATVSEAAGMTGRNRVRMASL